MFSLLSIVHDSSAVSLHSTAPSMASTVVPQYYINCMDCYLIHTYLSSNIILDSTPSCPKVFMISTLSPTAG